MHFGKNSPKTIAGVENRHIFASETTKTGQPVGVKTTKQQEIKNKKIYDYENNECNPNDSRPV